MPPRGSKPRPWRTFTSALEADLEIIPVINKIDLPSARPGRSGAGDQQPAGHTSGGDHPHLGQGGHQRRGGAGSRSSSEVPPPRGDETAPLRALIFDSHYDSYKGVVAYVRVMDGRIDHTDTLQLMATGVDVKPVEIGIFAPDLRPAQDLAAGEVGYIATGLKTVRECRVGDTITNAARPAGAPLPGYRKVKPMVFAGIYPVEGEDYADLKDALEKLQLNDASLVYEPETSQALNFGFRCGFLGMFHMEIIQERLEREYDLDIIVTAPSVEYEVVLQTGETDPDRLAGRPAG